MIIWGTLHFVSTTSRNFCLTEEVSKFAVIASDINKAKEYTFKGQARFLMLEMNSEYGQIKCKFSYLFASMQYSIS